MIKLGDYVLHQIYGLGIVIYLNNSRASVCWLEGQEQIISDCKTITLRPVRIVCKRFGGIRGPNRLASVKTPYSANLGRAGAFLAAAAVWAGMIISIMIPWHG